MDLNDGRLQAARAEGIPSRLCDLVPDPVRRPHDRVCRPGPDARSWRRVARADLGSRHGSHPADVVRGLHRVVDLHLSRRERSPRPQDVPGLHRLGQPSPRHRDGAPRADGAGIPYQVSHRHSVGSVARHRDRLSAAVVITTPELMNARRQLAPSSQVSRVVLPLLLLAAVAGLGARLPPPQAVLVVGTDYAFQVPEHIRAGETLFTFENRGTVRHEMSIVLLKEGFQSDSVLAGIVAGSPRRSFVEGQGALIVARPGEPPGPRLWMN